MVDDQMGVEILKLMDRLRKTYSKFMKEKDRKDLIDLNKRLYDKVGGIVRNPLQQNPLAAPLGSGNYQVSPARQAEAVDLKRLASLAIKKTLI